MSGVGSAESAIVGPRSLTSESSRPGTIAEPKRAGPCGAPTPPRKRRMLAMSVFARSGVAAPASSAHGWGSSKSTPEPIWRSPL